MTSVEDTDPVLFDAVTVYCRGSCVSEGVPEMAPVRELRASPAGRSGVTDHPLTVPETLAAFLTMETPWV